MQCNFFATADDLLPVFSRIESKRALTYTSAGCFDSMRMESLDGGASLPTLREVAPEHFNYAYLVTPRDTVVNSRVINQTNGSFAYAFDELNNPFSLTFEHGGFFDESMLVSGRVGTVSEEPSTKRLFASFKSAIQKEFSRVKAFWVGPNALVELRSGVRLAIGPRASREYDLVE